MKKIVEYGLFGVLIGASVGAIVFGVDSDYVLSVAMTGGLLVVFLRYVVGN